ncbi:MAG: septation protein SepH [Nocardioides sp.]|jgi:hypothetical protein
MVHLTLVGLSGDGRRLLLVDDAGAEFTLDANASLRAALRGDHTRLGQLEIHMESALRPRDIQMRIRAGETPEAVAAAAQTTVEKIMPFAAPVLAEREHIAERAQRASVRRRSDAAGSTGTGSTGTARTLGDTVATHLSDLNLTSDSVRWDSFRREDGRWTLTGEIHAGKRKGTARFTFDAPGNFVTADNDDARWLLGEETKPAATSKSARSERRLAAVVSEDELPLGGAIGALGDDAIQLVSEEPPAPPPADTRRESDSRDDVAATADLSDTAARIRETVRRDEPADREQGGSFFDAVFSRAEEDERVDGAAAVTDIPVRRDQGAETDAPTPDTAAPDSGLDSGLDSGPDSGPEPAPRPRRKGARASVPSWDEIMFGSGPNKD